MNKFNCPNGHVSDCYVDVHTQSNTKKLIVTCISCGRRFCKEQTIMQDNIILFDNIVTIYAKYEPLYYEINGIWRGDMLDQW